MAKRGQVRRSRARRALGWFARRAGWSGAWQVARDQRRRGFRAALRALWPRPVDWDRLVDRPPDGGRDAFARMARRTSEAELERAAGRGRAMSLVMLAGAVVVPCALVLFRSETSAAPVVRAAVAWGSAIAVGVLLLALAVSTGFAAWQIRRRRTGSLAEWLRGWPESLWR